MLQPAVLRPCAEQSAGRDGRHGAALLIAGGLGEVPGVPPYGEAVGDVGLKVQHDAPGDARCGGEHHHRGQVAGAEKGDAQKGDEKHQRRAEVAHQGQTAYAERGEQRCEDQVAPGEQAVKRGRAHQHEHQLHQFRGLHRQRADGDPVPCAENALTQQQGEHQQPARCDGGGPPQPYRQRQASQRHAENEENDQPQHHGGQLLI